MGMTRVKVLKGLGLFLAEPNTITDFHFTIVPLQEKAFGQAGVKERLPHSPIMDLSSPDRISAANSSRQACADCGFFHLVNHGVEQELPGKVFEESKKFFIPFQVPKLFMKCNENKNLEIVHSKEGFCVGHVEGDTTRINLNQ